MITVDIQVLPRKHQKSAFKTTLRIAHRQSDVRDRVRYQSSLLRSFGGDSHVSASEKTQLLRGCPALGKPAWSAAVSYGQLDRFRR